MPKLFAIEESEANQAWFDRYSVVHAMFGSFCARNRVGLAQTVALAVLFEVAERGAKAKNPTWFPHPSQDSLPNMVGDVISAMIGHRLARQGRL